MAGQNVTVKINGVKKEYPQGTRFLELAKEYQGEYAYPIVLAKEDGRLRELMKKISDGTSIRFVTLADKAGYSTYRRSMILLMLKAFYHVVGDNANIDPGGSPVAEQLLLIVHPVFPEPPARLRRRNRPFFNRRSLLYERMHIFLHIIQQLQAQLCPAL